MEEWTTNRGGGGCWPKAPRMSGTMALIEQRALEARARAPSPEITWSPPTWRRPYWAASKPVVPTRKRSPPKAERPAPATSEYAAVTTRQELWPALDASNMRIKEPAALVSLLQDRSELIAAGLKLPRLAQRAVADEDDADNEATADEASAVPPEASGGGGDDVGGAAVEGGGGARRRGASRESRDGDDLYATVTKLEGRRCEPRDERYWYIVGGSAATPAPAGAPADNTHWRSAVTRAAVSSRLRIGRKRPPAFETRSVLVANNLLADISTLPGVLTRLVVDVRRLAVLDLSFNRIAHIPEALGSLLAIEVLRLHKNALSDVNELVHLRPLTRLVRLTLMQNPFSMSGCEVLNNPLGGGAHLSHNPYAYRLRVLARLPTLRSLDFTAVTHKEREKAQEGRLNAPRGGGPLKEGRHPRDLTAAAGIHRRARGTREARSREA